MAVLSMLPGARGEDRWSERGARGHLCKWYVPKSGLLKGAGEIQLQSSDLG